MRAKHPAASPGALSVLGAWFFATGAQCQTTTVPIFLPGYQGSDWQVLRGSIVSSDQSATTYTVFCAQQTPLSCELTGELPFEFAEGPSSLDFAGSVEGRITADLNCNLAGTTAATCTGSTSYGSAYTEGSISGPTQTLWSTTLTGSNVPWGVLTLATPGASPGTTDIEGTAMETPTATSTGALIATHTSDGRQAGTNWMLLTSLAGAVMTGVFIW